MSIPFLAIFHTLPIFASPSILPSLRYQMDNSLFALECQKSAWSKVRVPRGRSLPFITITDRLGRTGIPVI